MRRRTITLVARQFWATNFYSKAIYGITIVMILLICFAVYTGWKTYTVQNGIREYHQRAVRESWENNPDKHPHRMAHYGSFAFRLKHPLSIFDFGLESYTGNAVYLEAHKQNTINFSEASLSTGLLRFGEISLAMLLQIILPLVITFLGYNAISGDRENGTLKIILTQGASWKEIIVGKSLGLIAFAMLILIPVFLITLIVVHTSHNTLESELLARYAGIGIIYLVFLVIICVTTIMVSATSSSSRNSLLTLLCLWLLLAIVLPRTTQALGSYFYPAPSKIEFETAIEEAVLKEGDSHNPDDPHYKHLKDSVLRVHNVASVEELPFNYGGFVMREGEKISANIYNEHLKELMTIYDRQNSLTRSAAFVNPFTAIRNVSIAFSGTDFESYKAFQKQSEAYRYTLAQKMNELQMELISNTRPGPNEKPHVISRDHWKELPDFTPRSISFMTSLRNEAGSVIALFAWCIVLFVLVNRISKTAKAI